MCHEKSCIEFVAKALGEIMYFLIFLANSEV